MITVMNKTHEAPLQAAPATRKVMEQQSKEEIAADKVETATNQKENMQAALPEGSCDQCQ